MERADPTNVPVDGRLTGKRAIVVGAGQTPGDTIGNGRAIAALFARAGASVLCVDRDLQRADDTATSIVDDGGRAAAFEADITVAADCDAVVADSLARWSSIDVVVNNAGVGDRGDGPAHRATGEAFTRIVDVNVRAMWQMCKAVLPTMRAQEAGAIVNVSSAASVAGGHQVAYEVSKAAVNRLTTSVAQSNAKYGVRCNAIALGLVDTPMAVGGIAAARGVDPDTVRDERDARVPLRGGMGSAWDTAYAALYLASDESRFVTGVVLPVDGGTAVRIG